jgi:Flp pilus assembly protein TadG
LRRLRGDKGTTLVEAAIITPLLFLLTFALIDFASMMYVYLALENGVSVATRYAVTGNVEAPPSGPPLTRENSIVWAMQQATPTLTVNASDITFSSMAPGGASFTGGVGGPNDIVKVTVNYDHYILTPLLLPFFPSGKIHFTVDSTMKSEPVFQQ